MNPSKLRIVFSNEQQVEAQPLASPSTQQVTVRLEEVFPVLIEAIANGHGWIQDFADDPLTISSDLYEVLLAYQHHRRAG